MDNDESKELSVSFDDGKAATQEDYYLDGTFGDGQDWQHRYDDAGTRALSDVYKLQETDTGSGVYMLSGIALEAGDEITLFAYKAGISGIFTAQANCLRRSATRTTI